MDNQNQATTNGVLFHTAQILVNDVQIEDTERQDWLKALPHMTNDQLQELIDNLKDTRGVHAVKKHIEELLGKLPHDD